MAMLGITIPIIMLSYGWRNVWYILGITGLCLSGLVYALIRNSPTEKSLFLCGAQSKEASNDRNAILQTASQGTNKGKRCN